MEEKPPTPVTPIPKESSSPGKPIEYRIAAEKLSEFKKRFGMLRLVVFEVKDEGGKIAEVHEWLFQKPNPLVAKRYWNTAAQGDVYGAVRDMVKDCLVFPAQDVAVRLMDECSDLPFDINNELRSFIQRIGKVSSKKV